LYFPYPKTKLIENLHAQTRPKSSGNKHKMSPNVFMTRKPHLDGWFHMDPNVLRYKSNYQQQ